MMSSFTVKSLASLISRLGNFRAIASISSMENQTENKVYFHYNHTDSCSSARWTARESYQFMYERPWQDVCRFYSDVVNGCLTLSTLFGTGTANGNDIQTCSDVVDDDFKKLEVCDEREERTGRWKRVTFKIIVSYSGCAFDGWQKQPGLNTAQEIVERSLGRFVDDKKAQLLKEKSKPPEGCALVAGRTDKGVSAIQQVCSFYTWRQDVKPCDIEDAINSAAPGKLRVVSVSEVSRVFHPNFSAKWRRYLYIFPLNDQENEKQCCENEKEVEKSSFAGNYIEPSNKCVESISLENVEDVIISNSTESEAAYKPSSFSVCRVNQLLRKLEGKLLSYRMFARDTKASRNM
ncbi:Detected protein of confused Function [Hibiscus syriacus]|uniref:Detected protein of confused Function n=1 Tax=Hibiscus syriacus TaxID=106335 RepID=A0A6A3D6B9_HIBSY|nr:Detected protein of confused Function [Hibiscus syriacus]